MDEITSFLSQDGAVILLLSFAAMGCLGYWLGGKIIKRFGLDFLPEIPVRLLASFIATVALHPIALMVVLGSLASGGIVDGLLSALLFGAIGIFGGIVPAAFFFLKNS